MGNWIAWICKDCEHLVLAEEKPDPIKWTDGHVCHFERKEAERMEKALQLGQAVEYENHQYRLERFLEDGKACQITNSGKSLKVPIESVNPIPPKKGTADAKSTKKKGEKAKKAVGNKEKNETPKEVERTPFGSRVGTKAAMIDHLLIEDKNKGIKYDKGYDSWLDFVKRLGLHEPTVGGHIWHLNAHKAQELKELGIVPPSYKKRQ